MTSEIGTRLALRGTGAVADASFVASAADDIAELLARVDELESEVSDVKKEAEDAEAAAEERQEELEEAGRALLSVFDSNARSMLLFLRDFQALLDIVAIEAREADHRARETEELAAHARSWARRGSVVLHPDYPDPGVVLYVWKGRAAVMFPRVIPRGERMIPLGELRRPLKKGKKANGKSR